MAGQSAKKQVASNNKILKEIHLVSGISFVVFAVCNFLLHRPSNWKPFVIFSIPAALCLYTLEKTGRPLVDSTGKIIRTGQDLAQEGLTEYLFDIIYLTVLFNLLSLLFNTTKIWWLYLVIPGFAAYKLYGLVNAGRQMFGGKTPTVEATASKEPEKSKRQLKMEKRGDKPKMRYR
jgi:hypothetical protein